MAVYNSIRVYDYQKRVFLNNRNNKNGGDITRGMGKSHLVFKSVDNNLYHFSNNKDYLRHK
jgi:hypothetical protein